MDTQPELVDGWLRNRSQPCDGSIRMSGTMQADEHVLDRLHGTMLIPKRIGKQYVSEFHTFNSSTYSCEMDIKDVLAALMSQKKISQNYLAEVTGVPQPTIHRILIGGSKEPRNSTIKKLANYFEISTTQLLGDEPIPGVGQQLDGATSESTEFCAIDITASHATSLTAESVTGYKSLQATEVKADLSKRSPEELMLILKIAADLLYKKSGL